MKRFKTHVPGLDDLIGGGLPHRGVTLLLGPPGTPRQLLLENVLWNALERDHRVLLLTTGTSPHELLRRAEEYGHDLREPHQRGDLTILNAFSIRAGVYHRTLGEIVQDLNPHRLRDQLLQHDPDLLLIDLLQPIHRDDPDRYLHTLTTLKIVALERDTTILAGCTSDLAQHHADLPDTLLRTDAHELHGALTYSLLPLTTQPPHLPKYRAPLTLLDDGTVLVHHDKILDPHTGDIRDADDHIDRTFHVPQDVARDATEDSDVLEDLDQLLRELDEEG
jgi:archaellum biogenesis ATPase FlaH